MTTALRLIGMGLISAPRWIALAKLQRPAARVCEHAARERSGRADCGSDARSQLAGGHDANLRAHALESKKAEAAARMDTLFGSTGS